ncbi:Transforming growth factor beta-like protein [Vibrio crassostreae]|nr:transforming growth factor beta-like protein [Vibrio crassostreae]CAK2398813.1 Transforming growth factor beta-like protein [Vibrio crassostreae]CAK3908703.1 Transforming growth factor beta-like protein [Vibrio crassostreae]
MYTRTRILFYLSCFFLSFNARAIDLSNSYVTFYEGPQLSDQAFLYPILREKDTRELTYLDDLILDSLRGGKLGYQYFDSGGTRATCQGSRGGFIPIGKKTTVRNLRVPSCYNSLIMRTRLCLYDKDNKYIGGNCTDSYYGHTFNPLTEKPSDYRYKKNGTFEGCELNPVKVKLSDIYEDSALAPEAIHTYFPIGTCRAVHLESPDYKSFTSILSQMHPKIYKRLGPKCTVLETEPVSLAHTNGTVIHPSIKPTKVGCL